MEVIAATASVTQLAAYSFSSIRCIRRLYTELKTGHSTYRDEESNINLLLHVIGRLSSQDIKDPNPVVPILIDISRLACETLQLLQPKRLLGFVCIPITSRDKLSSTFEALYKKQRLLQFYVIQENSNSIADIRKKVNEPEKNLTLQQTMASPGETTKLSVSNNRIQGLQEVGNGYKEIPRDVVNVDNNEVIHMAVNRVGNASNETSANVLEFIRLQRSAMEHQARASEDESTQSGDQRYNADDQPPGWNYVFSIPCGDKDVIQEIPKLLAQDSIPSEFGRQGMAQRKASPRVCLKHHFRPITGKSEQGTKLARGAKRERMKVQVARLPCIKRN